PSLLCRPVLLHATPRFTIFCSYGDGDHPDLHSFPTRRSSDLIAQIVALVFFHTHEPLSTTKYQAISVTVGGVLQLAWLAHSCWRSEEHTSELQSPYDLVCRLLLEKKKRHTTWLMTRRTGFTVD